MWDCYLKCQINIWSKNLNATKHLLIVPLGIYTFPEGVLTKHDGSKSCDGSEGGIGAKRPLNRLIVGFLGGTSGGRGTFSSRQPGNEKESTDNRR